MYNVRVLSIRNYKDAEIEIRKIGADRDSVKWMAPKAIHYAIKMENVPVAAANILKQEMLSKGGDVAVNRGCINCSVDVTDVIIMGTLKHFRLLIDKLKTQRIFSLDRMALDIERVIDNLSMEQPEREFKCGQYRMPVGNRTYIMGILNVTPDSFSDGGKFLDVDKAVERALEMVREGADIIDIGGESTRPGSVPVPAEEELKRVIPVIEAIIDKVDVPISIDTYKAEVAEEALKKGVSIVNDVWGLKYDHKMAEVVAKFDAGVIIMHNKTEAVYEDVMGDIIKFFRSSLDIAEKAGIPENSIILDPGIGFGKTYEHNLEILNRLDELRVLGYPILLGTSRKSVIGKTLDLPPDQRKEGTAATVALGIAKGVDFVRVHDVKEMAKVAKMSDTIVRWKRSL